jgi:hypothetical protein
VEEQVIKSLLEFYKERGTDLYAVLDDPIFQKLDLAHKIKIIKDNAGAMVDGTKHGLSKAEVRNILVEAGLAGALTGTLSLSSAMAIASKLAGGQILPVKAMALGIGAGAGIGAATSAFSAYNSLNKRKTLIEKLKELQADPTDNNAIKLMALRNSQVSPNTNLAPKHGTMVNALLSKIHQMPLMLIGSGIPDQVAEKTMHLHETHLYDEVGAPDENRLYPRTEALKKEVADRQNAFTRSMFTP